MLENESFNLAKEQELVFDYQKLCRTCLSSGTGSTNVHDVFFDEEALVYLLDQHLFIRINQDDKLPQIVCDSCVHELQRIQKFITACRLAEKKLQTLLRHESKSNNESPEKINKPEEFDQSNDVNNQNENSEDDFSEKIRPVRVPEPGPPYICDVCEMIFENLSAIKLHRKNEKHLRKQPYMCKICNNGKLYNYQGCLVHLRTHTEEKPYKCNYCERCFKTNFNKKRHERIHSGIRPYVCDVCGTAFSVLTSLNYHKRRHSVRESFKCEQCSRMYKIHSTYIKHLNSHEVENKPHECELCNKKFSTERILSTHKVIHSKKEYLCNECGKKFHYKVNLDGHINSCHRGIRSHECNTCGKSFKVLSTLAKHLLAHTGDRPFECRVCKKRFVQKAHLWTHSKTHAAVKPYVCSVCDRSFSMKGNLTVHMRTHTGETPYVCDICFKGFYDSTNLKKHKIKHK